MKEATTPPQLKCQLRWFGQLARMRERPFWRRLWASLGIPPEELVELVGKRIGWTSVLVGP